jgi:hypothetical protein
MPHTPGPIARGRPDETPGGNTLGQILRIARGGPNTMGEYEANVRLITAAPDLLEALRAIVHQVLQGSVLERDACLRQAQEAIAKATMKPG